MLLLAAFAIRTRRAACHWYSKLQRSGLGRLKRRSRRRSYQSPVAGPSSSIVDWISVHSKNSPNSSNLEDSCFLTALVVAADIKFFRSCRVCTVIHDQRHPLSLRGFSTLNAFVLEELRSVHVPLPILGESPPFSCCFVGFRSGPRVLGLPKPKIGDGAIWRTSNTEHYLLSSPEGKADRVSGPPRGLCALHSNRRQAAAVGI